VASPPVCPFVRPGVVNCAFRDDVVHCSRLATTGMRVVGRSVRCVATWTSLPAISVWIALTSSGRLMLASLRLI